MRSRYYTAPIPDGWFQVAYSDEIAPGQIVPLKYFDSDLALFRSESGQVSVLDAFCPHLGAHLAFGGKVEGSCVRCPFHAWKFDATGKCVEVPYAKRIPPKAKIRDWHVRELAGLIMVWHHAGGEPPQWELPEVSEYGHDEWTDYERRSWKVRSRNQELAENQVDSAHFHYVHGTTNMPTSQVEANGHIMRVHSSAGMETPRGRADGSIESLSYGFGFSLVRFKGVIETLLVGSTTPIDGEHVDVRFSFSIRKKLAGADVSADVSRGVGAAFINEVSRQLEQDIVIWENKIQWERPLICDGDGPLGLFRKWSRQFYSRAGAPAAATVSLPVAE